MADRFPLIVDSSTQRVKELPSGDNLDLTGSGIVNAGAATFGGKLTVNNQSEIYRPAAVGGSTSGNTLLNFKSDVGGTAVTKASITTDGSAEFANTVNTGSWPNSASTSAGGGAYLARQDTSTSVVWKALSGGTGASYVTSQILADGSVNFATQLITGSANSITSTSAHGSYIGEGVVVNAIQPNATLAAQERVWLGKLANVTKSQIFKDGSATFAGEVSANTGAFSRDVTNNNVTILYAGNDNGIKLAAKGNGTYIGTSLTNINNATPTGSNIILSTGGSAVFQAGVDVRTQDGQRGFTVNSSSSSQNQALKINNNGGSQVILLNHDGSAEFAGLITANGNIVSDRTSGSNTCFQATLNGSTKATINANGSATFDGGVVSKQEVYVQGTTTSTQRYLNFQDSGTSNYRATLRRDAWYLGSPVTNIGDVTPSGANIVLNMSGAATFQNTVLANRTSGSATCFQATLSGSTKATINADGSATFAARVDAGAITVDSNLTPTSGTSIEAFYGSTGGVIQAYDRDNSNWEPLRVKGSNWTIDLDGSATFGNTVASPSFYGNATGTAQVWYGGSTGTSIIKADGSATFGNSTGGGSGTGGMQFTSTNGQLDLINTNSGSLITGYNRGSTSQVFTVKADGKMLLGTTTEGKSGADEFTVATSGNTGITIRSGTSSTGDIMFSDGTSGNDEFRGIVRYDHNDNSMQMWSNASERARITSSGTSYFRGDSNAVWAFSGQSAGTSFRLFYGAHSAGTDFSGGTSVYTVWTNGNVVNANNSYGSLSDAKLKENIVDASSQWNDIKDLRVRNYNFIEGQTHTQIGVVAQEVETVSPGLVYESPDTDEEGNDLGTTTKSVNYSVLYMKSVKALQEAMDRIETLEAKVAALEAG